MKLSREDVLHIAKLARLGIDESEIKIFQEQLSNILNNFEILQQVDTDNVIPTAHSIQLQNVLKEDEVTNSLSANDVLSNAPNREGDFFRIRPVLE